MGSTPGASTRGLIINTVMLACPRCKLPCSVQAFPATLCRHCLELLVLERSKQTLRSATKDEFWELFDGYRQQYLQIVQKALKV